MKTVKKVRKAVRTFLIENGKVVAIKYKNEMNKDYYDILNPEYKGNAIIEYPEKIFDFDIYIVNKYNGEPKEFEENYSMWADIQRLIKEEKVFPSIEILKRISNNGEISLKIDCDENHKIINVKENK